VEECFENVNTVIEMIDKLERHGISIDGTLRLGSLLLSFKYRSLKALQIMWKMYLNGELLIILQSGLITNNVLKKCGAKSVQLRMYISDDVEDLTGNRNTVNI